MPGVFEMVVASHFSAAHFLKGYAGDCAGIHGHNWVVEVHVRRRELDEIGIGIDFRDIKKTLEAALKELDHTCLNDLPPFVDQNPTSENIARHLYRELRAGLNREGISISRIKVSETPGAAAFYWEERP